MIDSECLTHSEKETLRTGRLLAEQFAPPRKILLYGQLGAGKTALSKGLALGYGVEDPTVVHSPSFSLINEYPLKEGTLYHIDLYRLDSIQDLYSIGLEEILWNDQVVIIEWAEKLKLEVPDPLKIHITVLGDETRRIQVEATPRS